MHCSCCVSRNLSTWLTGGRAAHQYLPFLLLVLIIKDFNSFREKGKKRKRKERYMCAEWMWRNGWGDAQRTGTWWGWIVHHHINFVYNIFPCISFDFIPPKKKKKHFSLVSCLMLFSDLFCSPVSKEKKLHHFTKLSAWSIESRFRFNRAALQLRQATAEQEAQTGTGTARRR